MEIARAGRGDELLEIVPARFHQAPYRILARPGLDTHVRLTARGQRKLLAAPGALHHLPWIARRGRGMDDDCAGGSLACGAFVLVNPAAVIEPARAGEQVRIPVRIVVHHHEDLPREIGALEIIPTEFRRLDAVPDEDQLRIVDGDALLLHTTEGDVVRVPAQIEACTASLEAPALRKLSLETDDVERLLPGAVGKCGLVAHAFEPGLQVEPRELVAARGRAAPLEQIR